MPTKVQAGPKLRQEDQSSFDTEDRHASLHGPL